MEIGGGEVDGNDGCRERCCLKEVNEAVRPIFERMVQSHDDDVEILEESDTSSADEHVIACLTAEEADAGVGWEDSPSAATIASQAQAHAAVDDDA